MKIYNEFAIHDKVEIPSDASCLGAFDGIHLGHQKLFENARAKYSNFQIITFDIVPKKYFNTQHQLILDNNTKSELISKYYPQNLIFLKFEEIKNLQTLEFCDFLSKNCKTKRIFVGNDFRFGKNREGRVEDLQNYFGIENILTLDDVYYDNLKVSSTKIKEFLSEGNIEQANRLLGYNYNFVGKVIKGQSLGSKIGFPTANLNIEPEEIILDNGVYFVNVFINSNKYKGAMNIGYKPTVSDIKKRSIEIHILDFDSNIYDQTIKVEVNKLIRKEVKFNSIDQLTDQISKDIDKINKY